MCEDGDPSFWLFVEFTGLSGGQHDALACFHRNGFVGFRVQRYG